MYLKIKDIYTYIYIYHKEKQSQLSLFTAVKFYKVAANPALVTIQSLFLEEIEC